MHTQTRPPKNPYVLGTGETQNYGHARERGGRSRQRTDTTHGVEEHLQHRARPEGCADDVRHSLLVKQRWVVRTSGATTAGSDYTDCPMQPGHLQDETGANTAKERYRQGGFTLAALIFAAVAFLPVSRLLLSSAHTRIGQRACRRIEKVLHARSRPNRNRT